MKKDTRKRLILFDVDGVLVNTSWEGLFIAYKEVASYFGKKWQDFFKDLEEFKNWWDLNWPKNNEKLGIKKHQEEECHEVFYQHYSPYRFKFDWVDNMLEALSKVYKLGIDTNSHQKGIYQLLGSSLEYLDAIVCADDVKKLKPHPEGVSLAMEIAGIKNPNDVLMVGDLPLDLIAGFGAGTNTAAVSWGMGERNDFSAYMLQFDSFLFMNPQTMKKHFLECPEHLFELRKHPKDRKYDNYGFRL